MLEIRIHSLKYLSFHQNKESFRIVINLFCFADINQNLSPSFDRHVEHSTPRCGFVAASIDARQEPGRYTSFASRLNENDDSFLSHDGPLAVDGIRHVLPSM
jgi:hypothetical protein